MTTPKQIVANRRNARHSTGPGSPEGKAASSRNALKHGLRARDVVLVDETEAEFEKFREELFAAFDPQDAMEAFLADRVVANAWRLRRVYRFEAGVYKELYERDAVVIAKEASYDEEYDDSGFTYREAVAESLPRLKKTRDLETGQYLILLQRYENSLDRTFYKALHELERMQARRRGEAVLPPVVIDMSLADPISPVFESQQE